MSAVPDPVFVLAAPFCGASRLAGDLGTHPQLMVLPELCLFMADTVAELLDIFRLSQGPHADGLLRAVAVLEFGAQQNAEIDGARQWLAQRASLSVAELLMQLAQRAAPRRLVIPDTESPLRPVDLRRLRRAAPQAQVLHLTRHPWTQGCLMTAWARERLFMPPDFRDHAWDPPLVDPQIPWLRANRNLETAFEMLPPTQRRRLKIEMLEDEAAGTNLAELCAWIGVSQGAPVLRGLRQPQAWTFHGYGPRAAPYGLEAEVLEPVPTADRERAALTVLDEPLPWRPDDAAFDAAVTALARGYGYR